MSSSNAASSSSSRFKLTVKLEDSANFSRWRASLQDKLFAKIKNTNMDALASVDTLDAKYFKTHFKQEWKDHTTQDDDDEEVSPLEDEDFVQLCLDHALSTGKGFMEWLYEVFAAIRDSLNDDIAEQTAGVALGDLVGLFSGINLAIGHTELSDPYDLDHAYAKCTMQHEGQNDLMRFTAVLAQYMRRLKTANLEVDDTRAQRTLLRGLPEDIFDVFVSTAERHPYESYALLEKALKKFASKPRVISKLKALKPGNPRSVLTTQTKSQQDTSSDQRLDKLEAILTTMAHQGAKRSRGPCFHLRDKGSCNKGDKCPFSHDSSNNNNKRQRTGRPSNHSTSNNNNTDTSNNGRGSGMYCEAHMTTSHNTADCAMVNANPKLKALFAAVPGGQQVNVTTEASSAGDGFDWACVTRVALPQHVFAMRGSPNIDMWCVDGASTTMATWDRSRCHDIVPCHVNIVGPNSKADTFVCKEKGSAYIHAVDKDTGTAVKILVTDVLISPAFPFHIFSEIKAFKAHATAVKKLGSWQFTSPSGAPLFHASQRLLSATSAHLQRFSSPREDSSDVELYFIDEHSPSSAERGSVGVPKVHHVAAARAFKSTAAAAPCALDEPTSTRRPHDNSKPTKVSTAKNLEILLELHCALDHRNFADVARQFGLSLPNPAPNCWACFMAKPKRISHDVVSTRQTSRPFEGFAADAKGPITPPTPEGYRYFFVVIGLYSTVLWVFLAKSQKEWIDIWKSFVKKLEAKSGKQRCVAFIITDSHTVFTSEQYKSFNDDRGIQIINCSPYSQWQDPAERQIQTLMNAARTSLIHGGGKKWMWGSAVLHACDSMNLLEPSHPVPGHEGKSRISIIDPSMTMEKSMRALYPFLSLAFKTVPPAMRAADFNPRADPCVILRYVSTKKAFAMLTIPNLYLTHSVEVRVIPMCFPLRVTNHLTNQLDTFLRPTVEDNIYNHIHGPGNLLRRQRLASQAVDPTTLVATAPVEVHVPAKGPGWSSTRGYTPSVAGLESAASINTALVQPSPVLYTPDQLAARTPRSTLHALGGPDKAFWLPPVLKDFRTLRAAKSFINITEVKPPGPNPPNIEQRFKIKYRGDVPISLAELLPEWWKARTVARGDRFKHGEHYDATAAPVIHTPALKVLLAWGVAKGLLPYQWDQEAAFYGNTMDRKGVIVRLPIGYNPWEDVLRPFDMPPLYGELATALPGIPQGSLLQFRDISPALQDMGFLPADADNCLFIHKDIDMATSLHVDDGVLFVPSAGHAETFFGSEGLGRTRKLTWGPLLSTLGIDFKVNYSAEKRQIFMSQRPFAVTILERARMLHCNPARTPALPGRKYTKADCPATDEEKAALQQQGLTKELFHSVTASVNFLVSTITRDDMRFSQGKLAKYCLNPGLAHFQIQKHQLRFLRGTLGYGIEFAWHASDPPPVDGPLTIVAWSDSSFADDVDTGRTTLGDVIKVNGATVSASSKLSARVDSCVNHSELNAFSAVCAPPAPGVLTDGASSALVKTGRTVTWLRGIKAALERRDVNIMPPTPVLVDNAGVISMLEDATLKSANKHIFRALAENRERVNIDKVITPVKVATKDNIANAMTKQEHGLLESAVQLRQITGPMSV